MSNKRQRNRRAHYWNVAAKPCPNCGGRGAHFVPPSLGEEGFYSCKKKEPANADV